MALMNVRDLETTRDGLETWLSGKIPSASDVTVSDLSMPGSSGFSNDTIFFHVNWVENGEKGERDMVARFGPRGPKLFPDYDLGMQFTVMKALAEHTDLPMPEMLWAEESTPAPLNGPFYVMGRIEGKVPIDDPIYLREGWVIELTDTQREVFYREGVAALAKVHSVDWSALGLDGLARPELGATPLAQMVRYFEDYYEFARLDDSPNDVIDTTFAWIRENCPSDEDDDVVLNWGDARPGNLIYADDLSVAAVVDWELAFLGSRELDLAWWLFTQKAFSRGMGLPLPVGILDTDATIELYASLTGYSPRNMEFHLRFAGLRSALMMVRFCTVMTEVGALPPGATVVHDNPINQMLAHEMGMPSTVGGANPLNLSQPS